MEFIITIDTEADNQWAGTDRLTTENARYIPRFQALCDRYGFKPTYLCTFEMAADPRVQEILGPYQSSGRAEIGSHLHPWSTPPYEAIEGPTPRPPAFPSELPLDLFRRKMITLTRAVADAFGRPPTSYRAGRYGLHAMHVGILLELGYSADCSVVPYTSFRQMAGLPGGRGGADFTAARPRPYYLGYEDCTRPGISGLLEVPVTVLFPKRPFRSSQKLQRWWLGQGRSLAVRVLKKLGYGPCWLRPWRNSTAADLLAICDAAASIGLEHVEMIFHSSELMPGGSPEFPNEAAVERLYATLESTFHYAVQRGFRACTLQEFAHRYTSKAVGGGPAREAASIRRMTITGDTREQAR